MRVCYIEGSDDRFEKLLPSYPLAVALKTHQSVAPLRRGRTSRREHRLPETSDYHERVLSFQSPVTPRYASVRLHVRTYIYKYKYIYIYIYIRIYTYTYVCMRTVILLSFTGADDDQEGTLCLFPHTASTRYLSDLYTYYLFYFCQLYFKFHFNDLNFYLKFTFK